MEPEVVHEDNHVLVINKPAGLATMGTAAEDPSLLKWSKDWLKQKYAKPGNVYLGIVSRLDSVTSGLIVFAKTSKAAGRLTTQFQQRQVAKWYVAGVPSVHAAAEKSATNFAPLLGSAQPWWSAVHGRCRDWIWKDETARRMRVVRTMTAGEAAPCASGKLAELQWRQIAQGQDFDLWLVHLGSGRKHQIRLQLAHLGRPIIGDRKYGSKVHFPRGIALHAWRLGFQHPVSRQALAFQVPPPREWNGMGLVAVDQDIRRQSSHLPNQPLVPSRLLQLLELADPP